MTAGNAAVVLLSTATEGGQVAPNDHEVASPSQPISLCFRGVSVRCLVFAFGLRIKPDMNKQVKEVKRKFASARSDELVRRLRALGGSVGDR
jgi:hypothetical protein